MSSGQCHRYNSYIVNNKTFYVLTSKYEGIPQNLGVNVIAYMVLIGLFILLRKKAWNYGKLSWLHIQKNRNPPSANAESHNEEEGDVIHSSDKKPLNGNQHKSLLQRFIYFLPLFVKMSDEDLRKRCGADAVIYCQFQRYLMITVAVMMFFSLTVVVPVNIYGGSHNDTSQFSTLTIQNITTKYHYLWIHFCISVFFMLFAFVLSTRFLQKVDLKFKDKLSSTIMIDNVPLDWCDELSIRKHFLEAFPSTKVKRVQVTIKVDKLKNIRSQKVYAEEALNYCCDEMEMKHERVLVVPHACGRLMSCQCCNSTTCTPVDGVEYYSEEVIRLTDLFIAEKSYATINNKLPIVFVTFETVQQAMLVRRDYIYENYYCLNQAPKHTSSISRDLKSSQWNVKFAPNASDVIWENLHKRGWKWFVPVILANLVVAFVVIILSTPSMVISIMEQYNLKNKLDELKNPFMVQIIPALILVIVNSWMPILVCFSDQLSGHWTNTTRTLATMNKLYAILVTTILVLPSLGLNSIPAMFTWLFPLNKTSAASEKFQLGCIFMPDGGALFCNYLISASFIGTALELLRFGDLFFFMFKTCYSKSRAEDEEIAKSISLEFQFGLGYAWTLALFTMISAYAVIVPIITPFGLAYLIFKHLVDRHNLIHVNIPSEINNSIHTNAAQLMQIGLILTQATVAVYINLRESNVGALFVLCCMAFSLGVLLTFGRTVRRWIIGMSWYKYSSVWQPGDSSSGVIHGAGGTVTTDDEDFILVDHSRDSAFVPFELTIEEPIDHKEIVRRKSMISESERLEFTGLPSRC